MPGGSPNWIPGGWVVRLPGMIRKVAWRRSLIQVDCARQKLRDSPLNRQAVTADGAHTGAMASHGGLGLFAP